MTARSTRARCSKGFNLAALWQVPAIFVCENNLYATTVPVEVASVAGSITARATAFGIPAESCDGMDPDVVYAATASAVARARAGGGPTFLEFRTYRYYGHHTFETHARLQYRDDAEVAQWQARDPLALQATRISDEDRRTDRRRGHRRHRGRGVRFALASPKPDPAGGLRLPVLDRRAAPPGATPG